MIGVDRQPSWPSQCCATVPNRATASVATFVENAWVMQRQIQHLKREKRLRIFQESVGWWGVWSQDKWYDFWIYFDDYPP